MRTLLFVFFSLYLFLSSQTASGTNGAVSSAEKNATQIGIQILKSGGNAFDAAVAVGMALAVTHPNAGNIGGGGFMLIRTADAEIISIDFREVAPGKAFKKMYLDSNGNANSSSSLVGPLSSGVPGTVAGLFEMHQKYGKLSWRKCLEPAINLAENGYGIDQYLQDKFDRYEFSLGKFQSTANIFFKNGEPLRKADILIQKDLAESLSLIAEHGRDGFYKGQVASRIVNFMLEAGGLITQEDLDSYEPVWRKVEKITFNGYDIYTMPLPSSAHLVMGQILNRIEPHLNEKSFLHNSFEYIHALAELEKRAFADRNYFLGDPEYVEVPLGTLLDPDYLDNRFEKIPVMATPANQIRHGEISGIEHEETTHYSIIDHFGNAVSCTYTLNGNFGSKIVVPGTGILLNNEMDDFTVKPGTPNLYGMIQSSANSIEPGKRMLSSMSPTIVQRNDSLFFLTGSPGGSTILTTVLQTILNACFYGQNIEQIVSSARFHHQWLPDSLYLENRLFTKKNISRELRALGHHITLRKTLGEVNAILIKNNQLNAYSDPRGRGYAEAY